MAPRPTSSPLARLLRYRDAPRLRALADAIGEPPATVEASGLTPELQARLLMILADHARSADLGDRQNALAVLSAIT